MSLFHSHFSDLYLPSISFFPLVSQAKSLSIFLILPKNQLSISLLFSVDFYFHSYLYYSLSSALSSVCSSFPTF